MTVCCKIMLIMRVFDVLNIPMLAVRWGGRYKRLNVCTVVYWWQDQCIRYSALLLHVGTIASAQHMLVRYANINSFSCPICAARNHSSCAHPWPMLMLSDFLRSLLIPSVHDMQAQ